MVGEVNTNNNRMIVRSVKSSTRFLEIKANRFFLQFEKQFCEVLAPKWTMTDHELGALASRVADEFRFQAHNASVDCIDHG